MLGPGPAQRVHFSSRRRSASSLPARRRSGRRGGPAARTGARAQAEPCATLLPVAWRCQPPGAGEIYLADPDWSSDPRLRPYVIVALRQQQLVGGKRAYEPSRIWWLQMTEEADAIVAAGRLTGPGAVPSPDDPLFERFPRVSADQEGRLILIYLARRPGTGSWRLCRSALELDRKTGTPVLAASPVVAEVLGEGLAPSPVVPSADGRSVYATAAAGQIFKYPKPTSR